MRVRRHSHLTRAPGSFVRTTALQTASCTDSPRPGLGMPDADVRAQMAGELFKQTVSGGVRCVNLRRRTTRSRN